MHQVAELYEFEVELWTRNFFFYRLELTKRRFDSVLLQGSLPIAHDWVYRKPPGVTIRDKDMRVISYMHEFQRVHRNIQGL